jgi:hypothetical protein
MSYMDETCRIGQDLHKYYTGSQNTFSVKKLMTTLDLEKNLEKSLRIFQITENSNKITDSIKFSSHKLDQNKRVEEEHRGEVAGHSCG